MNRKIISGHCNSDRAKKRLTNKMEIETHNINDIKIAEVISTDSIIKNASDGLDLLGNLYYQGFDKIIIHEKISHLTFLT